MASPAATAARSCSPPRGPGDRLIHSGHVRIRNYNCRSARRLMIHCDRFSYGHSGHCNFHHLDWYCTSRPLRETASTERCSAAKRRLVAWIWLD